MGTMATKVIRTITTDAVPVCSHSGRRQHIAMSHHAHDYGSGAKSRMLKRPGGWNLAR